MQSRGRFSIKALKQNNIRTVLQLMRVRTTATVAEISLSIKLSKTTIKKLIDCLVSLNLVVSAGKGLSTEDGGKKPELFSFNRNFGYVISIHVTPDEILAATTDMAGEIEEYRTSVVGPERSLPSIIERVAQAARDFITEKSPTGEKLVGIVVSLPGLADSSKGVSIYSPHYHEWGRDVPFADPLRAALGSEVEAPIFIDCVNRYQAIAERSRGAAAGAANFIIIDALNEGLGSGIFLHGTLLQGNQSLSGEIGHMVVNPVDGVPCICGHRGCFEAMVSAKRILGLVEAARQRGERSVLFEEADNRPVELDALCAAAQQGDALSVSFIDDVARWFLIGLGNIIMVNDPELIVIQGQYVKAGDCFLSRLREGIRHIGLPDVEKKVRIEYSSLGEERGVVGGAAFVLDDYFSTRLTF
ncbi:MAG: ROK family protein [Spirochaetia bacterium]|jgi:predicted NBD/HSP70 family sugar kinase